MNYALLLLSNLASLLQYSYFNEIRYSRELMYIVISQCSVRRREKLFLSGCERAVLAVEHFKVIQNADW